VLSRQGRLASNIGGLFAEEARLALANSAGVVRSEGAADAYQYARLKEEYAAAEAQDAFRQLAQMRDELGVPLASPDSDYVLSKLVIGRNEYWGMNGRWMTWEQTGFVQEYSRLLSPTGKGAQMQHFTHAGGDTIAQAFFGGERAWRARLFVDKTPCSRYCQSSIPKSMRLLDLEELMVFDPANPNGVLYGPVVVP